MQLNTVVSLVNDLPNALYGNATKRWPAHEWSAPPERASRWRSRAALVEPRGPSTRAGQGL